MKPCKHLDYDGEYHDCKLREIDGFPCTMQYWERGPVWTEGPLNEGNPKNVQFCGAGRGRINGIFRCYNEGEMPCYEPEEETEEDKTND